MAAGAVAVPGAVMLSAGSSTGRRNRRRPASLRVPARWTWAKRSGRPECLGDPAWARGVDGIAVAVEVAMPLTRRYHCPGLVLRRTLAGPVGPLLPSGGRCPGRRPTRAEGVPQHPQDRLTTTRPRPCAPDFASRSDSEARACGTLLCCWRGPAQVLPYCLPVQHAVAAVHPLPPACRAQLNRRDRRLDAQAVQVLQVIVGHEPGMPAGRRMERWPRPGRS